MAAKKRTTNGGAGAGVDSQGRAVQDPTKNVLDLVEAGMKRQDDLREQSAGHLMKMAELRADYDEKLRNAETARINAIREVDVSNVTRAAEAQSALATTLAASVVSSAEALRNQVAAAATTAATSLGAALVPIQESIADLRRAQYEAQGQKTQVTETRSAAEDLKPLTDAIAKLTEAQAGAAGAKQGGLDQRGLIGWIIAIVAGGLAIYSYLPHK